MHTMDTEKFLIKLCCGGRGCPEVTETHDNRIRIQDDEGNSVVLQHDELKQLAEYIQSANFVSLI